MDILEGIIAYEEGTLDLDETLEFFQALLNSGMCWQLQGHYGRTAKMLIEAGHITLPHKEGG